MWYGGVGEGYRGKLEKQVDERCGDQGASGRDDVFNFKQKTAYEMLRSLVGSEMCI